MLISSVNNSRLSSFQLSSSSIHIHIHNSSFHSSSIHTNSIRRISNYLNKILNSIFLVCPNKILNNIFLIGPNKILNSSLIGFHFSLLLVFQVKWIRLFSSKPLTLRYSQWNRSFSTGSTTTAKSVNTDPGSTYRQTR